MNDTYKSPSPWGRLSGALIIILDIIIVGYLVFAVTSFNNPDNVVKKCTKVDIEIADQSTYGFLDAEEIKTILQKKGIYPLDKDLSQVSPRQIEEVLKVSPFVNTAECCRTIDGHVIISITQRSPLVRIKSSNGDDYYIDENGGIMPYSKYTSDLIIVTGNVNRSFAQRYISILARVIMKSDLWRNQIEQINVQGDMGIELVPRVGNQIIFLGYMPLSNSWQTRNVEVTDFVTGKLDRLEKFYRYGISDAGWNKYSRIDMQFDNQIICKKYPQYVVSKDLDAKPVRPAAPVANDSLARQNTQTTQVVEPRKAVDPKPAVKPAAKPVVKPTVKPAAKPVVQNKPVAKKNVAEPKKAVTPAPKKTEQKKNVAPSNKTTSNKAAASKTTTKKS